MPLQESCPLVSTPLLSSQKFRVRLRGQWTLQLPLTSHFSLIHTIHSIFVFALPDSCCITCLYDLNPFSLHLPDNPKVRVPILFCWKWCNQWSCHVVPQTCSFDLAFAYLNFEVKASHWRNKSMSPCARYADAWRSWSSLKQLFWLLRLQLNSSSMRVSVWRMVW